jgi:serine-type D-Ala-D-Ala carboxypeptidase (penicillin-binding protein 5/6)
LKHLVHRFSLSKLSILILFLLMIISVLSYIGFHYLSPPKAMEIITGVGETKPNYLDTNISTSVKDLSTKDESYILFDPQTTKILRSSNADIQRAPASTTKLLTGLIVLKTLQETDIVRVGPEVNTEGSQLGLSPGAEISVQDLLTALYVHSSNDAAAALAVKISGSIPAFAEEMNKYAASLGCQHSHFTNPHGLPDSEHYTTANDLIKVASVFLKNESLMKYVKILHAQIQWKDARGVLHKAEFENTNRLLGNYPGDEGLKTGTTTEAAQCLVSYVTRPDGDLLLVLLGSKNRYDDTIKLLDEGWAAQRSEAALRELAKDPKSLILSPGIF